MCDSIRANAAQSHAAIGALEQQIAALRTTVAAAPDHAADQLQQALEPLAAELSTLMLTVIGVEELTRTPEEL